MDNKHKILDICRALQFADAVLVGAGAGLSAAAGLDYSGDGFRKAFADYIEKYGFTDLFTSGFHEFATEEERWARWARHIDYARFKPPALPLYLKLFELVSGKNYFVITTNVDGQFRKAGFEPARLFEVQGDYGFMQCAKGCHPRVYSNEDTVHRMLESFRCFSIPSELLPHCPVCGGNMDINVRKNAYFVEDENWHIQATRYQEFLENNIQRNIVFLEMGVGFNTPGIIRYPFEHYARKFPKGKLVRINLDESEINPLSAHKTIVLNMNIAQALERISQCSGKAQKNK